MINYHQTITAKVKINKKSIVFDFDGTICEQEKYPKIGKPREEVIKKMKDLQKKGYYIIISSCRFSENRHGETELKEEMVMVKKWLKENDVPYDKLWMYDKPWGILYFDDRALNTKDFKHFDKELHRLEDK